MNLRLHQLRAGNDGIDALMRHRGVAAMTAHENLESAGAGHDRPRHHGNFTDRNARPVVQAINRFNREALEQTFLDHHRRTAFRFLGRLEDEYGNAIKVGIARQISCRAEQHGGMAVVATGVHLAAFGAGVGKGVELLDRQRVHVGTQANGPCRVAAPDNADHTGGAQPPVHRNTPFGKPGGYHVGGADFVETQFRMGVQITTHGLQVRALADNFRD